MQQRHLLTGVTLVFMSFAAGCEERKTPAVVTEGPTRPATLPATVPAVAIAPSTTTEPASRPSATQPALSYLLINNKLEEFPEARIRFIQTDDHLTAVLYTADPPSAINDDYAGNSYYLTMPLPDVKDRASLTEGIWRFKAPDSERQDTTDGVFLHGLRNHLQPMDVWVKVIGNGAAVQVQVAGQFLAFDGVNPSVPGMLTPVGGEVVAVVETKK